MELRSITAYVFDRFVLRLDRGALVSDGVECALRPKSFALLRHFVENPQRLIGRDEIMEAVWSGVSVSDDSIAQCVGDIRRALGDTEQRLLRTLPRRGYLFTAQVSCEPALAAPDATGEIAHPVALPDKPSIAVLPFQNMSGDPEQEYFVDGMVEEITTALSRIRWLFVIARNSSFTYKGQAVDVKRVGRELGVRYLLEGSVRKAGGRVRITAQLIEAETASHIWADRFDGLLEDIFELQDKVASSVAGVIEPVLAEAEQQRILRKQPERLDAWEAYQRGLWHFHRYGSDDNRLAQAFFRHAIVLDPNFAPGHYGYSLALAWDIANYSTGSFADLQATALVEARLAVSLDNGDAMAHAVLAIMLTVGQWELSATEARTAIALNPNSAFVMATLGQALGFAGYRDEGIEWLRRAMRVSPYDPVTWYWLHTIGELQLFSREFEAALETYRQVINLRPLFAPPYLWSAAALARISHRAEAEG